jgi:hypothetical protein
MAVFIDHDARVRITVAIGNTVRSAYTSACAACPSGGEEKLVLFGAAVLPPAWAVALVPIVISHQRQRAHGAH